MAKNSIVQITREHDGQIRIAVKGHDPLVFNPQRASLVNREYAQFFGWANRFMNKAATSANPETGRTDAEEKYTAVKALVEFYHQGGDAWDMKATGARATGPDIGLLVRALVAMGKAADVDAANVLFEKLATKREITREEAIKLLWDAKDVKIKVAELRAATNSKINADDLLGELDD
jgi:hypothetical protein